MWGVELYLVMFSVLVVFKIGLLGLFIYIKWIVFSNLKDWYVLDLSIFYIMSFRFCFWVGIIRNWGEKVINVYVYILFIYF